MRFLAYSNPIQTDSTTYAPKVTVVDNEISVSITHADKPSTSVRMKERACVRVALSERVRKRAIGEGEFKANYCVSVSVCMCVS